MYAYMSEHRILCHGFRLHVKIVLRDVRIAYLNTEYYAMDSGCTSKLFSLISVSDGHGFLGHFFRLRGGLATTTYFVTIAIRCHAVLLVVYAQFLPLFRPLPIPVAWNPTACSKQNSSLAINFASTEFRTLP